MRLLVRFVDSTNKNLNKLLNKGGELDIYINAVFRSNDQSGFETTNIIKIETQNNIVSLYTKNSIYKFQLTDKSAKDAIINCLESENIDQELQELFDDFEKTQLHF